MTRINVRRFILSVAAFGFLAFGFLAFGILASCSSKDQKEATNIATFYNSQLQTYRVQLVISEPIKALQLLEGELAFESLTGNPVEAVTVTSFEPTMPTMGHGTDTTKISYEASPKGKSYIKVKGIWFNMGGSWEIALTASVNGASDKATIKLEVP
jgi:hypothetical protein